MSVKKFRDLTLVSVNEDQMLVIACDSSGAVGNKKHDKIQTDPEILGYYIAIVALSEVLAFGASPISIVNTLSVEMDKTGQQVLQGIKRAVKPLSLPEDIIITGSTEENFTVCQTGIGVTVIGIVNKNVWKPHRTKKGALAVVVGLPKVGDEVLMANEQEILTIPTLLKLKKNPNIQEILPVGSKGIFYEANKMANTNNLEFVKNKNILVDLDKSAGPATCAVVSIKEEYCTILEENCLIPVNRIGTFV